MPASAIDETRPADPSRNAHMVCLASLTDERASMAASVLTSTSQQTLPSNPRPRKTISASFSMCISSLHHLIRGYLRLWSLAAVSEARSVALQSAVGLRLSYVATNHIQLRSFQSLRTLIALQLPHPCPTCPQRPHLGVCQDTLSHRGHLPSFPCHARRSFKHRNRNRRSPRRDEAMGRSAHDPQIVSPRFGAGSSRKMDRLASDYARYRRRNGKTFEGEARSVYAPFAELGDLRAPPGGRPFPS